MRTCRVNKNILKSQYSMSQKTFWDVCKNGFEKMFNTQSQQYKRSRPHVSRTIEDSDKIEILRCGNESKGLDWDWYVTARSMQDVQERTLIKNRGQRTIPFHFENDMYEWFSGKEGPNISRIFCLRGNPGIGKTTFLRYFFTCYLRRVDLVLAKNTYVVRLPMAMSGISSGSIENYFDKKIYEFLRTVFNQGKYDLSRREALIEMALLDKIVPSPKLKEHYETIAPPPEELEEQLEWIWKEVIGGKYSRDGEVPGTADFIRLSSEYLHKLNGNLKIVVILDDVDQLSSGAQKEVWQLVLHKMQTIKHFYFVIPATTRFVHNAPKESPFSDYKDYVEEMMLFAPSLYDVLRQRKEKYFDPIYPRRNAIPKVDAMLKKRDDCFIGEGDCELYNYPNEILSIMLHAINQLEISEFISGISNFDIRQEKEVFVSLLQYSFCDWVCLGSLLSPRFQRDDANGLNIISKERILDSVLRKANYLCKPNAPFFDNVYNVNGNDHFSNSLCKVFILKILSKGSFLKDELIKIMAEMGHPRFTVLEAIDNLIEYNIISSKEIRYGDEVSEVLASDGTTLCRVYMDIIYSLFYVQAMAYYTPLAEKYARDLPEPQNAYDDSRLFKERIMAAKALLDQISDDLREQENYFIENKWENYGKYIEKYDLLGIGKSIKKRVKEDIVSFLQTSFVDGVSSKELIRIFD